MRTSQPENEAATASTIDGAASPALEIDPTFHVSFGGASDVGGLALSPDGGRAYVVTSIEVLDCWGLAVSLWPELLGGFSLLMALAALLAFLRVRRRPQTRGAPHCRRCNYDLSAHVRPASPATRHCPFEVPGESVCPECGVPLSRQMPRRGRVLWRRAAPIAVPAVLLIAVYSAMWAARLPRQGRAAEWLEWYSTGLAARAKNSGRSWLMRWVESASQFVELDLLTGERRPLVTAPWATFRWPAVAPDGRTLYAVTARTVGNSSEMGLARIALPHGRVTARVTLVGATPTMSGVAPIIGFWDGGRTVFVETVARTEQRTQVLAWDPAAGTLQVLLSTDAKVETSAVPPIVWGRAFALRAGAARPRFVSVPGVTGRSEQSQMYVHGPDGTPEKIVDLGQIGGRPSVAVTPDGETALVPEKFGLGVISVDVDTGERGLLRLPMSDRISQRMALSGDGKWLVAESSRSVLLRNTDEPVWSARLRSPWGNYMTALVITEHGTWVGALFLKQGRGNMWTHEVVLWNTEAAVSRPAESPPGS